MSAFPRNWSPAAKAKAKAKTKPSANVEAYCFTSFLTPPWLTSFCPVRAAGRGPESYRLPEVPSNSRAVPRGIFFNGLSSRGLGVAEGEQLDQSERVPTASVRGLGYARIPRESERQGDPVAFEK